jgi:ABC-type bacteriocin/lantibiotic exporter with double-glycine peptidase domain
VKKDQSPVTKLLSMVYEDRREFAAILVYSLMNSLLFLAVPLAAQGLVNVVVSGLYLQPLIVLTGALLSGLVAAGVLTVVRFYLVEVMRERIFARVALQVAERLPRVCHRNLSENNGPELMNRFFDVINIQKSWFKLAYEGPGALLEILVGLSLLGLYGSQLLVLATGLLLGGVGLITLAGYGGLRTSLRESAEKYRVAEWLEEMVHCHDALKINSRPGYWAEETDRRVVRFLKERRQHFAVLLRQKSLYYFLSALALSGMLGMGGYLVIQGELTLGQLVAAELVIWGILKASQKMITLTESLYDLLTGLVKVSALTSMAVDTRGGTSLDYTGKGAEVSVEGLSFGYTPQHMIFQNLSLRIKPGEMVTLLGSNGSGKSSLVGLLAGFLKPFRGSVEIDQVDLREFESSNLSEHLAVLSDQAHIFAGTLIDNVGTGRQIDLHKVKELLDYCDGRRLLGQLPQGAHSVLSSGGTTLSASEREALLLTRCLVDQPRFLLLDNSLSHFSEPQQQVLSNKLAELKEHCTVLSTIPLPDLVASSDRVLFLTEGALTDLGSPEALLKAPSEELRLQYPNLLACLPSALRRIKESR